MRSILVTGAGGSAGNNVCWSLRVSSDGKKIVLDGTDVDRWTDRAYQLPPAKSPRYLTRLNQVVKKDKVEMIFPQPDSEVGRLSRDRDQVRASIFLPDREAVRVCQDKYEALSRWFKKGLRKEPTVLSPRSRRTRQLARRLAFPCWVRARQGAGGSLSCLAKNWRSVEYWVGYGRIEDGFHRGRVSSESRFLFHVDLERRSACNLYGARASELGRPPNRRLGWDFQAKPGGSFKQGKHDCSRGY